MHNILRNLAFLLIYAIKFVRLALSKIGMMKLLGYYFLVLPQLLI